MEPSGKQIIGTLGDGGAVNMAGAVADQFNQKAHTTNQEDPFKSGGEMSDVPRPGTEGTLGAKAKHAMHTIGETIHNITSHITPGN